MTSYATAIITILLAVIVNALQANSYSAALPSLKYRSIRGNATVCQLMRNASPRESSAEHPPVHSAIAVFSIPWDGPAGMARNYDLSSWEQEEALDLLRFYTDSYYGSRRNDVCRNVDFKRRLLSNSLNRTNSNNLLTGFSSGGRKDEKYVCANQDHEVPVEKPPSNTPKSCRGYFSLTIFGVNLHVSFNCDSSSKNRCNKRNCYEERSKTEPIP
ncbi:hypothetical protein VIN7_6908 [Saccharomyces cerevisiae x Saccharomyces kudriavzevii VIN7]|uniref:Uncharacterized protein n=1 Tax=Saccharomyces cerevisiae x Saccharomyces kudriavzevii (strain VIN7) TaxID=1095631 RepID=H0GUC8_SACCK|nr:hypothetical protein VIN7_6908 [Saccharomyces cerevisiae x Saccharomyces kudriavzevii VIN7]CAI5266240.1 AIS_HP2_G0016420.mRNA.1.CDS.1 [Saccharomyces cerevisiae]CAI6490262.1 AIS_HP2_G0016420.mRNA.1.CDS.1 [Saccharomyces cerevisiae]